MADHLAKAGPCLGKGGAWLQTAARKERLALVEEDDGILELRLAQNRLRREAMASLRAQHREVDEQDTLAEPPGDGVGRHRLTRAARPAQQQHEAFRLRDRLGELRLAAVRLERRHRVEKCEQP